MAAIMRMSFALTVLLSLYNSIITGSPVGQNNRRESNKYADVGSKLSRLQVLLKELEKQDAYEVQKPKTTALPEVTSIPEAVKEPMGSPDSSPSHSDTDKQIIEKLADSLSPKDIETLKALRRMIGRAKEMNTEKPTSVKLTKPADKGTFYNGPVTDKTELPKLPGVSWRDLATHLQQERDRYYLEKRTEDEPAGGRFYVHTDEGGFVSLRDDIKKSVEKNLMNDIALAIDSGISVEEIVQDLHARTQGSAGQWGDHAADQEG